MKLLVTGATGFLGQKTVQRLHALGYDVTALGRNEAIGQQLESQGIRFTKADLRQCKDIMDACRDMDMVLHCGALSSPWGRYDDFYHTNVEGTRHVIDGCRTHGVKRLIHVSTPSIYFAFQDCLSITEDDPLPRRFANAYAHTKHAAEQDVFLAAETGLETVILRPRALFGPGDTTIIPRLIRANEKGFVPLINGGMALLDVTYIDNVVDSLLLAMHAPPQALGKAYNITNGQPIQLKRLLDLLFARMGVPFRGRKIAYPVAALLAAGMEAMATLAPRSKEPLLTRYTVGVLAKSQTLDISAARRELGYEPAISIEEGIDRFVQWWQKGADGHSL
ncbi:UNVERIFIED_CONTAM: nucleoside-diphosphate-sugar epimerase [Brevibacillus sp. OAP136]